jgi:Tfp pilus assembly protein PilE
VHSDNGFTLVEWEVAMAVVAVVEEVAAGT